MSNLDKLVLIAMDNSKKMLMSVYLPQLGKDYTSESIGKMIDHILSKQLEDIFRKNYELLLTEDDMKAIVDFKENYAEKVKALEVLVEKGMNDISSDLDEDILYNILEEK